MGGLLEGGVFFESGVGGGGLIEDLWYLILVPVVQMSDSTIHRINH